MYIKILLFIAILLIILRWVKRFPGTTQQPPVQTHFIKEPDQWKSPFTIKQIVGVTEITYQDNNPFFKIHLTDGVVHKLVFEDPAIAQVFYQSLFDQLEAKNSRHKGGNA